MHELGTAEKEKQPTSAEMFLIQNPNKYMYWYNFSLTCSSCRVSKKPLMPDSTDEDPSRNVSTDCIGSTNMRQSHIPYNIRLCLSICRSFFTEIELGSWITLSLHHSCNNPRKNFIVLSELGLGFAEIPLDSSHYEF